MDLATKTEAIRHSTPSSRERRCYSYCNGEPRSVLGSVDERKIGFSHELVLGECSALANLAHLLDHFS